MGGLGERAPRSGARPRSSVRRGRMSSSWRARPLVERLLQSREPLVLVSAPAGSGKTVLLTQWLRAESSPGAWLRLDGNDNDTLIDRRGWPGGLVSRRRGEARAWHLHRVLHGDLPAAVHGSGGSLRRFRQSG